MEGDDATDIGNAPLGCFGVQARHSLKPGLSNLAYAADVLAIAGSNRCRRDWRLGLGPGVCHARRAVSGHSGRAVRRAKEARCEQCAQGVRALDGDVPGPRVGGGERPGAAVDLCQRPAGRGRRARRLGAP